jgi:hypothetical protein
MAPVPNVGAGFSPLDEELALPPGQLTPLLQEWVVHLGAWVPFGQVPRLLSCFAGLGIARETARRLTEAAGTYLVTAAEAAAPPLAPPADPGPDTAARLLVSADGAMVRLQRGEWVEVKTVAVGQVGPPEVAADGSLHVRTSELSYFSRQAPVEEFTRQAVVELHRRGVRCAAAVAGVADGALWVQSFLDYHCPAARRILDLPHAAEHLGALAGAVWGPGTAAAAAWQQAQVRELREHGAAAVLPEVAARAAADPANEGLAEQAGYLERRAAQMDYPAFVAAGWPIGSGVVESANKLVVEARLKGAGMGWGDAALNPMLALRNTVCNDRWAEGWATVAAGQAAARAQRRRGGAAAPVVLPQSPPAGGEREPPAAVHPAVVAEVEAILARVSAEGEAARAAAAPVHGKPGPRHPWRHSPLGPARQGAPV